MKEELINQVVQILLPVLATILTAVVTSVGNRIKKVYQAKIQSETAKLIVDDTVRYVQQVYKDLDGDEKLSIAIKKAEDILASKGIVLSDVEINTLIESSVFTLKNILMEPKTDDQIGEKSKLAE